MEMQIKVNSLVKKGRDCIKEQKKEKGG